MIFAVIVLVVAVIVFFAAAVFSESDAEKSNIEKYFERIVAAVLLIGSIVFGIYAEEILTAILAPFFLFFFVCIYAAKEDRTKQQSLLKEMNEKLEKMEEELASCKKTNETENSVNANDVAAQEENGNTDGI